MATVEVVGLGAMNIDWIYRVDSIVVDGEQIVKDIESFPGGSAANTVYGLAKLGINTGFVGSVGDDKDGKKLISDFKAVDVDTSQIKVERGSHTGTAICLSDKLGKRALYIVSGANDLLRAKDIDLDYLKQARISHCSSFVNDAQFEIQTDLSEKIHGTVKISLAPGMLYASKGFKALSPLFKTTYVVFLNREEIECLTGEDFRTGAQACLRAGCQIVVVTLGKGIITNEAKTITSYIRDMRGEYHIEADIRENRNTFETTGAGDAFAAGFLLGLLKGKRLEECGTLGDIMAQFAIREVGARKGLPTLPQLSQKYLQETGHKL